MSTIATMTNEQSGVLRTEFKVVLIGELGVGKSSLFVRIRDNRYTGQLTSTIGLDYLVRKIKFKRDNASKEEEVQVRIWDTAGLERTGSMQTNYYKTTHAVILMYDVMSEVSLTRLKVWLEEAQSGCKRNQYGRDPKYFMIGNKIDCLHAEMEVDEKAALDFAKVLDIPKEQVFRLSAKTSEGVDEFLRELVIILTDSMLPTIIKESPGIINEEPKRTNHCC